MKPARLTIPGQPPPSLNALPDANAPLREAAAPWRDKLAGQLVGLAAPSYVALEATAELHFSDRRRRSEANYTPLLAYALRAALRAVGWLPPDGDLRGFRVEIVNGAATPETRIEVREARP